MHNSWAGSLSAALFSFRVAMTSTVSDHRNDDDTGSHQYSPAGNRIRIRRVDEVTGKEVAWADIVKGWQTEHGLITMSEDDYCEALGGVSRDARILLFCDPDEIPLIARRRSMIIQPAKKEGKGRKKVIDESAVKSYVLLRDLLVRTGKVAVVVWGIQEVKYMAEIRPWKGRLLLTPLEYAEYLREPGFPAPEAEVSDMELTLGEAVVAAMTEKFDHTAYKDDGQAAVSALVARKAELLRKARELAAAGKPVPVAEAVPEPAPAENAPAPSLEETLTAMLASFSKTTSVQAARGEKVSA